MKFGLERLEDRVLLAADLAMDKSVVPTGTVVPGELVTYTIHAQNLADGTTAATGVVVTDMLPAGETLVDATVAGSGAPTISSLAGTVTANLGTLAPGGANTIVIRALVNNTASGTLTNSAAMTNTSGDTNPTNATASNTVSTTAPTNSVSVTKDSVPTHATGAVGAPLTYQVTITNHTTTAAANVQLIDTLDPNETFVSASDSNGGTFTNVGGTITGTVASLAGSGTDTVTIVAMPATAAGNSTVTNMAAIAIPTGNLSSSVVATETNAVTPASATGANVSVTQGSLPSGDIFTVGAPVIYAATVTNNNTTAASGVLFVEHLDPNEAFVSASDDNGDTFTSVGGTITGTITSLPGFGADTIRINFIPTTGAGAAGSVSNTAIVAVPGGNLSTNNVTTNTNLVNPAPASGGNVSVTKDSKPSNATGTVGAALTYQVTITNNSTTPATGASVVQFYDRPDPKEQFVSATDSNGDSFQFFDGAISGLVPLAGSGTDTISIVAVPTTAGSVTNTAGISIFGGNQSNNIVATKTNPVNPASGTGANVSVVKDSVPGNATGTTGAALTYQVTLTNNTTSPVSGVQFFDVLDPNELFVSASDTNGDSLRFDASLISGTVNLAATGVDTITIVTTPTVGSAFNLTNTAAVAIAGGNLSTNIVATKTNKAVPASTNGTNIVVEKDSVPSNAVGAVGAPLTYHVLINNDSPTPAANVLLTDVLDANETFVSASDNNGTTFTNAGGTITGTIATLAGHTTDTVTVVATPLAGAANAGHVTNTATVTSPGGNVSGIIQVAKTNTVTAAPTQASVSITKTGPTTGTVGTNLTYTITVANAAGAASAAAVMMTDILPAGVTFVSATDTSGGTITNTGSTLTDNIGAFAGGATDTVTIVVMPGSSTAGATITNSASVTTATANIGTPTTASANTFIAGAMAPTGVGFLAGVPGDGTAPTFVRNLYRELLGREPDSAGDSFWVSYVQQHDSAAGRSQAVSAFMNSQEYAIHFITTVYQVILGRAPDAGGMQFWTAKMGSPGAPGGAAGSADEKAIVAAIFGSDEFYIRSGSTVQGWIDALYEDILGRSADGSGAAFWANELAIRGAGDRDGIVRDLLTTPEAAHLVLDSFYPAAGGTSGNPLPAPGSPAGTGSTDLASITGDGCENLYLQGPYDSQPQGNDSFFNALAAGARWDDVQLLLLGTSQFYTNPNRPITN